MVRAKDFLQLINVYLKLTVGVGRVIALCLLDLSSDRGRKVRAPKDRVPDNVWEARAYGKCHRKYTAFWFFGIKW